MVKMKLDIRLRLLDGIQDLEVVGETLQVA